MHRHTIFAVPCPAEVQLYPSMMNETLPQDRHAVSRIETLISKMTLAEKLGQLTMTASSYAVTGPIIAGDSTESIRSEEHTSELQSLMRISYAVFCLKKKNK